jgi:putative ABC transport system substrate-binding protein
VRDRKDIIVAVLTPAIAAAKEATREIPIVMGPAGDPIGNGFVTSLARPGGNITGVSGTGAEANIKTLELIREVVPSARTVGMLVNARDPFTKTLLESTLLAARTLGVDVRAHLIDEPAGIEAAFVKMRQEECQAILIQGSLPVQPTVDLALKYRFPALSQQQSMARAGALMSYNASYGERGRVVAGYVDRIIKGAQPADLPVQQPTRFNLTINLKTAKALGIEVPPALLARADEVIE